MTRRSVLLLVLSGALVGCHAARPVRGTLPPSPPVTVRSATPLLQVLAETGHHVFLASASGRGGTQLQGTTFHGGALQLLVACRGRLRARLAGQGGTPSCSGEV